MRGMGLGLGRLMNGRLRPMIDRVFALMLRENMLATPPEILQGRDIDIEYVSPLAKAQKLTDLQSVLRGFEVLAQLGEIAPVQDYIDPDRMVQYLVETTGMPARVIRSDEEIARLRREQAAAQQAQAAQQQELMEAQVMQQTAPMVKALGV